MSCKYQLCIPEELAAFLPSIKVEWCASPVWSLSRSESGFSVKLFWRTKTTPFSAHPHSAAVSKRKLRSRQRMEKFIEKKSAENQGIPENPSHEDIKPMQVSLNSCSEPSQHLHDVKQVNLEAQVSVGSHELPSSEESCLNVSRFDSVTVDKTSQMHYSLIDADTCSEKPLLLTDQLESKTAEHNKPVRNKILKLSLPKNSSLTKVHEDFIKCDELSAVRDEMKKQWSSVIFPGVKVKIKHNNDVVPAVVVECNYFSRSSFDCNYYYATAKATVKLSESNTIKDEVQFRDLIL